MDIVDFIMEWEQGGFIINDKQTLLKVIDFAKTLKQSQGKYERLFNDLMALDADNATIYPIII